MSESISDKQKLKIKHKRLDSVVQGTNDSSIVSKESVVLRGYPVQQSFLSSFVYSVQRKRRAPLINRGYFVRMRAVELALSHFLKGSTENDVVVNLGAGFDPMALNYLRQGCNCSFIDVDFKSVADEKIYMIRTDNALRDLLGSVDERWYEKKSYLAFGCDLRDPTELHALRDIISGRSPRRVLFIAEVSITYMSRDAADRVIKWASSIAGSQFVLIEQIMPAGASHLFTSTMIDHFQGLGSPLRCLATYPSIDKQIGRFRRLGWSCAHGCDLLDIWDSLTPEERQRVEAVEDFEEWEEFLMFCQHYCVITTFPSALAQPRRQNKEIMDFKYVPQSQIRSNVRKCFASSANLNSHQSLLFGGISSIREASTAFLSIKSIRLLEDKQESGVFEPNARMCHCMVGIAEGRVLMIGGRTSPRNALVDCWLWDNGQWRRTHDLPSPRFRHCAACIGDGRVVAYGGKAQHPVLDALLLWSEKEGWKVLKSLNDVDLKSRWGSAICAISKNMIVIVGGADESGRLLGDIWKVEIEADGYRAVKMHQSILRLGTKLCLFGDLLYVVGGVSTTLNTNLITRFDIASGKSDALEITTPFMGIGHEVAIIESCIVVFGGGGVCFSFGGYMNSVALILSPKANDQVPPSLHGPRDILQMGHFTTNDFIKVCEQREPVVFRKIDIGPCQRLWMDAYLQERIGERQVVIHSCKVPWMSFHEKNFVYEKTTIRELIDRMQSGKLVYLRSTSTDRAKPALLEQDFPEIAGDYRLPEAMQECIGERKFSSVLRIAGAGTGLWLHYDVMANLLSQVRGSKKMRLYHPKYVGQLSFPPGASSSTIKDPSETATDCFETTLNPGDTLYIPPLWPHSALAQGGGIAVNTFWRDLDPSAYAHGRDIYGNRDLRAYEEGRSKVRQLERSLAHLPSDQAAFYLKRLAKELEDACHT